MTYEKKVNIGYSTIGKHGIVKIVSIMNFLQDTAAEHSAYMGLSGFDLARENLAWVIFRYHVEIINNPAWQDEITIRTDSFSLKDLYEIREFTITEAEADELTVNISPLSAQAQKSSESSISGIAGKRVIESLKKPFITARVCWIMVNKNSGRPVRLSRFMDKVIDRNQVLTENGNAQNRDSAMNNPLKEGEGIESYFHELIKPETIHYQLMFKVRMHDLDLNGHVNNAIFVEWGVETVPEEILSNFSPACIDVLFHKEALYGDLITSHTEIRKDSETMVTLHSIIRQQDQTELARLNICWNPVKKYKDSYFVRI